MTMEYDTMEPTDDDSVLEYTDQGMAMATPGLDDGRFGIQGLPIPGEGLSEVLAPRYAPAASLAEMATPDYLKSVAPLKETNEGY